MVESINAQIENELKNIQLPKYHIAKFMDDTDEFIIYNYTIGEYTWSNNKADSYVADISILISVKSQKKLYEMIQKVIDETDFQLIATGQHKDTQNWESIFYFPLEVFEDEF